MAIISSHVLDSVRGDHASGIRVECLKRSPTGKQIQLFDVIASDQGRISEVINVGLSHSPDDQFELVFHSQTYFDSYVSTSLNEQILQCVVIRLNLADPDGSYHVPIMLAPHSYSVWWSGFSK